MRLQDLKPSRLFERYILKGQDSVRQALHAVRTRLYWKTMKPRMELATGIQKKQLSFCLTSSMGFLCFTPGTFAAIPEIVTVAEMRVEEDRHKNRASRTSYKAQLWDNWLVEEDISLDSPLMKFALQEDILLAVTDYLGTVPILTYMDIWYSPPADMEALANSQFWHCDWDAVNQVKMFVTVSDIGPENGPFTLINADTSRDIRRKIGYRYVGRHGKVDDRTIAAHTEPEDIISLTGTKGQVALVDTSQCFHQGSRVEPDAAPRILVMYQYSSPAAFNVPADYTQAAPFRHLIDPSLTTLQSLVLGA